MSRIKKFGEYVSDKISKGIKKIGDTFSIICNKCGERMDTEYHIPGMIDSMYFKCPKCGNITEQGDDMEDK